MKMNEQRTRANSRLAEQDEKDRKEIHKQAFLFLFSFFFFLCNVATSTSETLKGLC